MQGKVPRLQIERGAPRFVAIHAPARRECSAVQGQGQRLNIEALGRESRRCLECAQCQFFFRIRRAIANVDSSLRDVDALNGKREVRIIRGRL